MSVALPVPEESAMIIEPIGKVHTTSNEVPDITSLVNIMEQVRERGSPVERDDGEATITEVGAPTTRHTYGPTQNIVEYLKFTCSKSSKRHKYFLQMFFFFC